MVVAHLIDRTRQVLGSDEPAVFDERQALKDVGLDSLMAVELRNVLTRSLGTSLPATLLFDYPSLDALARFVMAEFDLAPPVAEQRPGLEHHDEPSDDAHGDLVGITDDEAEALLLAELGESEGPR